jgi:hypothetical protein
MRSGRQSNGEAGEHDTSKDQPLGEIQHGPAPVPGIPILLIFADTAARCKIAKLKGSRG